MSGKRVYNYNEDYFEQIDSRDKAYFLGILYADGYNFQGEGPHICLNLQEGDIDVLEKFKEFIQGNYPIRIYKKSNPNHQSLACLQICGRKISNDLANLACPQAKTNILKFPTKNIVPNYLISHFIRGYFDGDGSVWEGKRITMNIKDLTRKSGRRDRIVHNVKFNFTGTISVIIGIQDTLIRELGFKKVKINISKRKENCVQLEYSGRGQLKKLYNFLYNDSVVHMNRKKNKFETILNIKNENHSNS